MNDEHGFFASVLRDLITPHHVIRYLLHDDTLHILRLWHQRENPPGDT